MADILHIYPTRLKCEAEIARRLDIPGGGILLGAPVLSFQEFESALEKALAPGPAAPAILRELLLHEAVTADPHFRKRPHLSLLTGTDGFIRSLGELVQQLKLGLVTAAQLKEITGYAPGKEDWILSVFGRYQKLLEARGQRDTADVTRAVLEKLPGLAALPRPFHTLEAIHIHGVFHFAPSRFELLRHVQRLVPVTIHFPLPDDRRKVFDFVERDIQKFQSMEEDAGRIDLAFEEPSAAASPLDRFAAALFGEAPPADIDGMGEHITITRNAGRYREIEEVAEAILNMKGKRRWSDFCLVFRGLEHYGGIVEDVFRRARIPVYLRRGVPLAENPYIKTVLGIFAAIEKDHARDEVSRLGCSPYFGFLPPGVAPHTADRMLVDAGITSGGASAWNGKLDRAHTRGMKGAGERFVKLVERLEKLEQAAKAGTAIAAFDAVLALLKPLPPRLDDPFSLRDHHARSRLTATLAELKQAVTGLEMTSAPFTWRDLRRAITSALENAPSADRSNRNNVYVLTVDDLAGLSFPHLFICGLHDGEFPRRVLRGAILGEGEKQAFNHRHAETVLRATPRLKRGRAVFSRLGESWDEESFLFYRAVRSASSSLRLSCSAADLNGTELPRSPFLDEIMTAFPSLKETVTPAIALEKNFVSQLDDGAQKAKLLSELFTQGPAAAGALASYYARFISNRGFALSCERSKVEMRRMAFYDEFDPRTRAAASTPFSGRITPDFPFLRALFDDANGKDWAPTTLERYAKCPYRFFAYDVLQLKAVKLPEPGFEPTEVGRLVHRILEFYYEGADGRIPAAPHLAPLNERRKRMNAAEDRAFKEREDEGIRGEPVIWEITREQVRYAVRVYLEREEEFFREEPYSVLSTEFNFGAPNAKPMVIPGDPPVRLKGSADRIDYLHGPKLLRVIDYKHSANTSVYRKLVKPGEFFTSSFQVPIYLYAAMARLAPALEPVPAGAVAAYLMLKKEPVMTKPEPSPFDHCGPEELAALSADAGFGGKLRHVIGSIRGGEFSVTPADPDECARCDFRRVCRYRRVRGVENGHDGNDH